MIKNILSAIITILFIFAIPYANTAQIRVFESEKSDSTKYTNSFDQDSVFIVYKGENNKSTITLFAGLNDIDSLNFDWYKYNKAINDFELFESTDTVKTDTIFFPANPEDDMNDYEGGYRINIHNQAKGIDTTFTIWLWYQDFFINSVTIYSSSCTNIELVADTAFQDTLNYYDLSEPGNAKLSLANTTTIKWIIDTQNSIDTSSQRGARVSLSAPVEPTTYIAYGIDSYGFNRIRSTHIDETKFDNKGYPYLRAVKSEFSGIHGVLSDDNRPTSDPDSAIQLQAPHGVMFFNESQNAELFEWVFYNHIDWRVSESDTTLLVSSSFEPSDSVYYFRPKRNVKNSTSPDGYNVKLSVWGPIYNINNDRCLDTMPKVDFVLVDTTEYPNHYTKLPNVFSPNDDGVNDYFHFMKSGDEIPVKSIKYFSIKIYNRWGNKIYEYEDNDGSWHERGALNPGWDGVTRVGTKAKTGVYYYAIYWQGWDGRDDHVGGYVHLFN